jgi:hypothetical protein
MAFEVLIPLFFFFVIDVCLGGEVVTKDGYLQAGRLQFSMRHSVVVGGNKSTSTDVYVCSA